MLYENITIHPNGVSLFDYDFTIYFNNTLQHISVDDFATLCPPHIIEEFDEEIARYAPHVLSYSYVKEKLRITISLHRRS